MKLLNYPSNSHTVFLFAGFHLSLRNLASQLHKILLQHWIMELEFIVHESKSKSEFEISIVTLLPLIESEFYTLWWFWSRRRGVRFMPVIISSIRFKYLEFFQCIVCASSLPHALSVIYYL